MLMCAPKNFSADLLCSALGQAGITKKAMLRLNDPRHPPPQVIALLQNILCMCSRHRSLAGVSGTGC